MKTIEKYFGIILGILLFSSCNLSTGKLKDNKDWDHIIENGLAPLVIIENRDGGDFTLEARMKEYNVPGVSIAVIDNGEIAWAKAYGIADLETKKEVDENTMFRSASISKPVTAMGSLCLVDKGVLKLDSAVNKKLLSWHIPDNRFTKIEDVTLRHLLSHSGGISDDPDLSYEEKQEIPTLIQILNGEFPAKSIPVSVDTIPGVTSKYSNQGYCIIQLLMSDGSGKSFSELMDELVLSPVGMTNSTFEQDLSPDLISNIAAGYRPDGKGLPGKRLNTPALAAAGLWTTPTDLAKFAIALTNSYSAKDGGLLSKETINDMLTVNIGEFGLGLRLKGEGEDLYFTHGGSSDGYRCYMLMFPNRKEGVVVMTNSDSGIGLYYEIIRGISSELDWTCFQPVRKTIVELKRENLEDLEGTYLMGNMHLKICIEDDHLTMGSPLNTYTLFPESNSKFFEINYGFTMEFVRDSTNTVSGIILDRGGVLSNLTRIE